MLLNDILQLVVLLDNYTTIGPSDRDSNLKFFFFFTYLIFSTFIRKRR